MALDDGNAPAEQTQDDLSALTDIRETRLDDGEEAAPVSVIDEAEGVEGNANVHMGGDQPEDVPGTPTSRETGARVPDPDAITPATAAVGADLPPVDGGNAGQATAFQSSFFDAGGENRSMATPAESGGRSGGSTTVGGGVEQPAYATRGTTDA